MWDLKEEVEKNGKPIIGKRKLQAIKSTRISCGKANVKVMENVVKSSGKM